MEHIIEFIKQTPGWGTVAAVLGVIAALVSEVISARLLRVRFKSRERHVEFANEKLVKEGPPKIDFEADTRLAEARHALRRQETSSRWNKWSMHSLTFSQYVMGGVLATSFIQAALPKETVGLLGVLVLVASLIHQRFRPDVQYRNAKERAALLRGLIRKAEDEVYAIRSAHPDAKSVHFVRHMVSDGLSKIEASELADVTAGNGNDAA